jgi:hypothetical protein
MYAKLSMLSETGRKVTMKALYMVDAAKMLNVTLSKLTFIFE